MSNPQPEWSMKAFNTELKAYLHTALIQARRKAYKEVKNEKGATIEKKMTQEDMAAFLHITPRSYGELERGKSSFSAATLIIFLTRLSDDEIIEIIHDAAQMLSKCEPNDWGLGLHDGSSEH